MSQVRKSFTTPKGSELPLLSLKGKEYLQVAHRLVWFREERPNGVIKTTMLALQGEGDTEYAVFKAEIFVEGVMVATAHKKETRGGFDDFIEKAETGAIGRALALAGFGTQFTGDELDEKNRLADAPIQVIVGPGAGVNADKATTTTTGSGRASFRKTAVVSTVAGAMGDDI